MANVGLWILIFTLVLFGIVISVLYTFKVKSNASASRNQLLYPFAVNFDPTTGQAPDFVDATGNPQIQCPAGSSINIVGAFFNVFDPYNTCVADLADVSPLMTGYCSGTAPNPNVCSTGMPNTTCTPSNASTRCAIRDASALLSSVCNGQQTCEPEINPSTFGDYPCTGGTVAGIAPQACISVAGGLAAWTGPPSGTRTSPYCSLPYVPGFPGGLPQGASSSGTSDPQSFNLGYTIHGFYTCVPN